MNYYISILAFVTAAAVLVQSNDAHACSPTFKQVAAAPTSTGRPEGPFYLRAVGCPTCVSAPQLVNGVIENSATGGNQPYPGTYQDGVWTPDSPLNPNNEYVTEFATTAEPAEVQLVPVDPLVEPSIDAVTIIAAEIPDQVREAECEVSQELCPGGTTCSVSSELEQRDGRCIATYEVAETLQHQFAIQLEASNFDPHRLDCEVTWEIDGSATTSNPGFAQRNGEFEQTLPGPKAPLAAEACAMVTCADRETGNIVESDRTCETTSVSYSEPAPVECTSFDTEPDSEGGCSTAHGAVSLWIVLFVLLRLRRRSHE